MKTFKSAILIVTLAALFANVAAATDIVRVKGQSGVIGPAFTLGEIADIEVDNDFLREKISSIRIGVSPMPGSWRELDKRIISDQLARNGLIASIKLISPRVIRVFRQSQTVGQEMLESRIRDFINNNAPWDPEELEISRISATTDIILPSGDLEIRIRQRGSSSYLGATPFVIELLVNGVTAKRLVVQTHISVYREAVVTASTVPANQLIGPADVKLQRIDISSARGQTFSSVNEVIGMATTTYLMPGKVVTRGNIRQPILVRRGQTVALFARSNGFVIRTDGVAKQDGRKGDIIKVLNTNSKKIIEALVTGIQKADVLF